MWSRRHFLCAASAAALAWADDKSEAKPVAPPAVKDSQKTIAAGLKYLKAQQHKDGSFGTAVYKGNVGITSLCGLAILSGRHQPGVGEFGATLDSALDFVLSKENAQGGQPGFLHNPAASPHGPMYNHGLAVMFLAAAHDKVSDKKRSAKLHEVLGRAVALTLRSQNREKGWRYLPSSADSDLTVTGVQVFGLRLARDVGIGVPRAALAGAAGYAKRCQDQMGGFRYMARSGGPNWTRTAVGVLTLYNAGITRGAEVKRGLEFLLKNRPNPKVPRPDIHYYFGHYHAALTCWAAGGETRKKWFDSARDELIARQGAAGNWTDVICPHSASAMALIALQAPNGILSPDF